ncbi:MAG: FtsX-like permease family protein [Kibdelosporangium sp.]
MVQHALRTLRFRMSSFVATFLAVFVGSAIVVASGGLMETGIRVAVPPERLAAAQVVVAGDQSYDVPNEDPDDLKDIKSVALAERHWLDPALVDVVRSVPGVVKATGETAVPATVVRDGKPVLVGGESLGHDWASAELGPYRLDSGQAPGRPGQVVLDASTARLAAAQVGSKIDVAAGGTTATFEVTGIAAPATGGNQRSALFFSTSDVRDLGVHGAQLSAIGVFAKPGTDLELLAEALGTALADQPVSVLVGDDRGVAEYPEAVGGGRQLIPLAAVFAGLAVFIAMFVVAGTLGLAVQQRRRELALLRAIGATPGQVRRMIVAEALVVAVIAAVLGCAPGVLLGPLLYDLVSEAGVIAPVVRFHQGFIAYLAGPAVAILATFVAALVTSRRAARMRPTEALVEASTQRAWVSFPRVFFAILFFVMGIGLFIVTATVMAGPVASATAGPAVLCWSISLALIGPGVTKLLIGLISGPVRAVSGVAGYLAIINARAGAVRLAAAVTPIMLAVGIAVANFYTATTQTEAAQRYFADGLGADVTITAGTGGFGPEVVGGVRDVPGIAHASEYVTSSGWIDKPYDGSHVESPWPLQGVNAQSAGPITGITPVDGDLTALRGATVALPVRQASAMGVGVGAQVTLRLGDRETEQVRVVALFDAKKGYETILLPSSLVAAHSSTGLPRQILLSAEPGADLAAVTEAVRQRVAGVPGATVGDRSAVNTFAQGTQTQAWVNYLLAGIVTAYTMLSVANTLVTATASRRRELGMQRLIGVTRRQVTRMLGIEAALIAVTGIILGTVASAATLMPFSTVLLGRPFPAGPLWIFLAVAGVAFVLTMVTTLVPARRITRMAPIEAATIPG